MAYPDSLDTFTHPEASDPRVGLASNISALMSAVESVEETVGVTGSFSFTPVLADPGAVWESEHPYAGTDRILVDVGDIHPYVYAARTTGTSDVVEPTWTYLGIPLFEVDDGTTGWYLLGPVGYSEGLANDGAGVFIRADNQQVILGGEDVVARPQEAFRVEAGGAVVLGAGAQAEFSGATYALLSAGDAYLQADASSAAISMGGALTQEVGGIFVSHLVGTADPSSGAGVTANVASVYLRNVGGSGTTGEMWVKTGAADTAWTKVV